MSDLPYVTELSWKEARPMLVKQADPEMITIIDEINPSSDMSFILARYTFGDILKDGTLYIPTKDGNVYPIEHHKIEKKLRDKLNYRFVPMGLILNKSVEVYFESEDRIMPSKLYSSGDIFGLWQLLDPEPEAHIKKLWNLSSGARSIFMLPMISDATLHAKLKRDLKIHSYAPKKLSMHRDVFSDIAKNMTEEKRSVWTCDVLYFTKKWFDLDLNNFSELKQYKYWLLEAWRQSLNCRNQMNYSIVREAFSKKVSKRNIKPKPYILNTINHLMSIKDGIFPGFVPAQEDEIGGPIGLIQKAYIEHYGLKNYFPTILHPSHLSLNASKAPVYYSLTFPTLLDFSPASGGSSYLMNDMRELKLLMKMLEEFIGYENVEYDFFHSEHDRFNEIESSHIIAKEDDRFLDNKSCVFAYNGPFLRGCIRIKEKEKELKNKTQKK